MDNVLNGKIAALGLHPVDDTIRDKYLKKYEDVGIDVTRFKYYKLYGQHFMPYSKEHLIGTIIEELLKRDKENYKRFCPSFFVRLKDKYFEWKFKRWVKKLRKNFERMKSNGTN